MGKPTVYGQPGRAGVAVLCALIAAFVWAVALERIAYERQEAARAAARENSNLALAFEEHTVRTIRGLERILDLIRREYVAQPGLLTGQELLEETLGAAGSDDASLISAAGVVDGRGEIVVASRAAPGGSVADREYFRYHRENADSSVFISAPLRSRTSGRQAIFVTRRIDLADGRFGGVAVVGIDPQYFTGFYDRLDIGEQGLILLTRRDGTVLARRSGHGVSSGGDISATALFEALSRAPSGELLAQGRVADGVERFLSYRQVRGYPLVVAVGTSRTEAMAAAAARERGYLIGALAGTLLIALFGGGLFALLGREKRALGERERAQAAEQETAERFRQLAESIREVFWLSDPAKKEILYVSPAYEQIWGRPAERLRRSPHDWVDAIHPEDRARVLDAARSRQARGEYEEEYRIVRPDGEVRWIRDRAFPVVRDGRVYRVAGVAEDITGSRQAEARYRATFEQGAVGIAHMTLQGEFTKVNEKLCEMLGYDERELLGRRSRELTHAEDRDLSRDAARSLAESHDGNFIPEYEKRYVRKDGSALWVSVSLSLVRDARGRPEYLIAIVKDVSARTELQAELARRAHYDDLTGLPNRVLCFDRLAQALAQAGRKQWSAGVLYIDLDRLKNVNETLGHMKGDALLRLAAQRFAGCIRPGDTVGRIGGDEFAAVLAELRQPQDAAVVAQKIVRAMRAPFSLDGNEAYVTASIGIAVFPADGADGDALLGNAAAAMWRAKQAGRNQYRFYTAEMNKRALEKLLLENDLRRALERAEFHLEYQPKVSLRTGRITGVEALLRWRRPGHGVVSAGLFVPVLEASGLIVPAGDWIIEAACAQVAAWRCGGIDPVPVAVNLSAKQFLDRDVGAVIDDALRRHDVEPSLFAVEVTETTAMQDPEQAAHTLRQLKERGIRVAIDDFGTGYSSLGYLKRFPLDALKLDRSFVAGLPGEAEDVSIALAVLAMARSLGIEVVAEGVETEAQRAFLAEQGCSEMQGYLFSPPVPPEACAGLLQRAARPRIG